MHPLIHLKDAETCVIHRRLNRFVVEIEVNGETTTAYINNTGRLLDYLKKGKKGFCLENTSEKKTGYRLFAVEENCFGAVIDTNLQMKGFEKAFSQKLIPWLKRWCFVKRNVRLGDSIIDYLFNKNNVSLYLEVKSAVLREKNLVMYPDCPLLRGRRHIKELINHASNREKTAVLFIAALPKIEEFKPYEKGDPVIKKLLVEAKKKGVMVKSISMFYNPTDSTLYLEKPDLKVNII